MRGLVIHLLFILSLTCGLFAHHAPSEPAISYWPSISKSLFQPLLKSSGKQGILFGTLLQPPHTSMVKTALATGKHAFFQGVYGNFHIATETGFPAPCNKLTDSSLTASNAFPNARQPAPVLIVGKDFAWLYAEGLAPRVEKRPVTPEDLGATFMRLAQKQPVQPLGGRDVSQPSPWPILVTHTGKWEPNISLERMRYRGLTLLSPEGILENGLTWNNETLNNIPAEKLPCISPLLKISTLWWNQIMNRLAQPAPVKLPANNQAAILNPNQWQRSRVEPALPYMPAADGLWTPMLLNDALQHLPAPGIGGSWRLDVPREGNYEIVFSLNSPSEPAALKRLFKKGEALIQAGNTTARLELMEGAEEIRIALDLAPGRQYFEINVTKQGDKDASLSVPYASIRYKGERITPVIDFQNRTK